MCSDLCAPLTSGLLAKFAQQLYVYLSAMCPNHPTFNQNEWIDLISLSVILYKTLTAGTWQLSSSGRKVTAIIVPRVSISPSVFFRPSAQFLCMQGNCILLATNIHSSKELNHSQEALLPMCCLIKMLHSFARLFLFICSAFWRLSIS